MVRAVWYANSRPSRRLPLRTVVSGWYRCSASSRSQRSTSWSGLSPRTESRAILLVARTYEWSFASRRSGCDLLP